MSQKWSDLGTSRLDPSPALMAASATKKIKNKNKI
jgi:hypothetical protein